MPDPFRIHDLALGAGRIGICRMPGRGGDYAGDFADLLAWGPALVLTMTTAAELDAAGAGAIGADLGRAGIGWAHLPVADFTASGPSLDARWPAASAAAHGHLAAGRRVLAHCKGGCGRSGMALLRLMVEAGEAPGDALNRLRGVRPCAVETPDQRAWAAAG